MSPAEFASSWFAVSSNPQSPLLAMCPPHVRTTLSESVTKSIDTACWEFEESKSPKGST